MPTRSLSACLLRPVLLVLTGATAACEESFDPIAPSELAYSVFGYLDASADTQWIRVMPIRPLKVTSQDASGITVTLEDLETGRIIELADALRRFSDPTMSGEGLYVHNFWTTEAIEPGATYRFLAMREGREPAEAIVEVPRDYEVEVGIGYSPTRRDCEAWDPTCIGIGPPPDSLWITGLNHLPFLTSVTHFYDDCGPGIGRIRYDGRSADDGRYRIGIRKPDVPPRDTTCHAATITNRELWIVGSEAPWPGGGYSPAAFGEGAFTSNVTNAVGYLGGVILKHLPYEDCTLPRDVVSIPAYCRLPYNPETAMLIGTVTETRCGDGPIGAASVQLTEIGEDSARTRTVLSARDGHFLIGAQPGIPHFLWSRAPDVVVDSTRSPWTGEWIPVFADVHTHHTDTLTFMPGQKVEYEIRLERTTPCSRPPRFRWP